MSNSVATWTVVILCRRWRWAFSTPPRPTKRILCHHFNTFIKKISALTWSIVLCFCMMVSVIDCRTCVRTASYAPVAAYYWWWSSHTHGEVRRFGTEMCRHHFWLMWCKNYQFEIGQDLQKLLQKIYCHFFVDHVPQTPLNYHHIGFNTAKEKHRAKNRSWHIWGVGSQHAETMMSTCFILDCRLPYLLLANSVKLFVAKWVERLTDWSDVSDEIYRLSFALQTKQKKHRTNSSRTLYTCLHNIT